MDDFYQSSKTETNTYSPSLQDFSSKSSKKNKQSQIKIDFDILSNMEKSKFIDSSINKFYTKYLQKQAFIQHEQKIYEILEKNDEPKIFNSLRLNYLKEKEDLKNMGSKQNNNRKVTDIISFVNLNNCKKKLYSLYKLSADDLAFMTSFMDHLGHRQKKIYKPKVNKKLDALSKGKLGNFLKTKDKNEKNKNNKRVIFSNIISNNKHDEENHNKNYLKVLLKKLSNDSIKNNKSVEESKPKDENLNSENNSEYPQGDTNNKFFMKKNTMNLNSNKMKIFRNSEANNLNLNYNNSKLVDENYKKYSMKYNNIFLRFKSKSKNDSSEENKDSQNFETNENILNRKTTTKFNNILNRPSNVSTITNFRDSIINKINSDLKNTNNNKEEIKINIEDSFSNSNDKNNKKESNNSLMNSKQINNNEEKVKILKLYKTSRNEFLQKVKQEGNILNKTGTRLFSLLYKLKNENFETFQNERNKKKILLEKNAKTLHTQENINTNRERKKLSKTYYPGFEKSRFRIPYINKVVYGENNQYDTFEELQKELFHEVKYQIRKAEIAKKRNKKKVSSIVGREILEKLVRTDSEDRMKRELNQINNNQGKISSNRKHKNKSKINSIIKSSSSRKNEETK